MIVKTSLCAISNKRRKREGFSFLKFEYNSIPSSEKIKIINAKFTVFDILRKFPLKKFVLIVFEWFVVNFQFFLRWVLALCSRLLWKRLRSTTDRKSLHTKPKLLIKNISIPVFARRMVQFCRPQPVAILLMIQSST